MKYKQAAHLLAFFSVAIFVIAPGTLYLFNHDQWNYDYWLVLYFSALGAVSFISLYAIYYIINKFSNKCAAIFAYTIFTLGLITLLNDILSPVQLGLLDGRKMHSDEPLFYTLLELAIACLVVLFICFSLRKNKQWLYVFVKPVYFVGVGLIIFSLALQSTYQATEERKIISNNTVTAQQLPNIYHFHIDGMQTDYFLRYMHNHPEVKKTLTGFTLFEKNIANYHTTVLSLSSYLTSTTHLEGRFDKWLKKYDHGLLKKLKETGYRLIHSSNAPHRSKYFDEIIAIPELLKKYSGAQHSSMVEFTRIWLAKIIPNFLTNESLFTGKNLGKHFFYTLNPHHDTDIALTMEDGTGALEGILLFKDITADIAYYSATNQYIFSLNPILHSGYLSSPHCTLEKKPDFSLAQRYYRQFECTMKLIEEFVSTLKSINRYDNSLIVIHGDHGSHFVGQLLNTKGNSFATNMDNADNVPYDNSIGIHKLTSIESKARALLMIKPLSATGEMQVSDVPTQLLDVYPTIMGQLGINNLKNIAGTDIFNNQDLYHRQRYFYYMSGSAHETQITNYHIMVPQYDKKSGVLSLIPKSRGKTTAHSFFKNAEDVKKYKDIKFYYTSVDGKIITDVAWIFFDGMDILNHWGAWTNSDKVTLAFVPEDASSGQYNKLILKIADAFINNRNPQLSAKFYLNKTLIGSLAFNMPKSQYSFPQTIEFILPQDVIIKGQPNILEIHMEGANSEKNLGIGKDTRKLGLGLVDLSLNLK